MDDILSLATTDAQAFMERLCRAGGIPVADSCNELRHVGSITAEGVSFSVTLVHENDSNYVERVFSISHKGRVLVFVQDTGFYDSYDGTHMDGKFCFVVPRRVTITKYVKPGQKASVQ